MLGQGIEGRQVSRPRWRAEAVLVTYPKQRIDWKSRRGAGAIGEGSLMRAEFQVPGWRQGLFVLWLARDETQRLGVFAAKLIILLYNRMLLIAWEQGKRMRQMLMITSNSATQREWKKKLLNIS